MNLNDESFNNVFKPIIKGFKGEIKQDDENPLKWHFYGKYEKVNDCTIHISEYCYDMTYERIERLLTKLEDEKSIYSYINNSKENIDITIKITKENLAKLDDNAIRKLFCLDSSETEILNVLDEKSGIEIPPTFKSLRLASA